VKELANLLRTLKYLVRRGNRQSTYQGYITLELGKEPTSAPIYALSEKELATLREYLAENEKKELNHEQDI
jgi:hypothetical protein